MTSMFALRRCSRPILLALLLAILAACGGKVRPVSEGGSIEGQYDMIVTAYKGGQFLVDGAVLAAPDLDGHFGYLDSLHRVPKSVLIEDGSESPVRGTHLSEFAQFAAKYGFTGYVSHKGKVRALSASDADD